MTVVLRFAEVLEVFVVRPNFEVVSRSLQLHWRDGGQKHGEDTHWQHEHPFPNRR